MVRGSDPVLISLFGDDELGRLDLGYGLRLVVREDIPAAVRGLHRHRGLDAVGQGQCLVGLDLGDVRMTCCRDLELRQGLAWRQGLLAGKVPPVIGPWESPWGYPGRGHEPHCSLGSVLGCCPWPLGPVARPGLNQGSPGVLWPETLKPGNPEQGDPRFWALVLARSTRGLC